MHTEEKLSANVSESAVENENVRNSFRLHVESGRFSRNDTF